LLDRASHGDGYDTAVSVRGRLVANRMEETTVESTRECRIVVEAQIIMRSGMVVREQEQEQARKTGIVDYITNPSSRSRL
jgi:hypothetical protein